MEKMMRAGGKRHTREQRTPGNSITKGTTKTWTTRPFQTQSYSQLPVDLGLNHGGRAQLQNRTNETSQYAQYHKVVQVICDDA